MERGCVIISFVVMAFDVFYRVIDLCGGSGEGEAVDRGGTAIVEGGTSIA